MAIEKMDQCASRRFPTTTSSFPNLQQWVAHYGGYHNIPPEAWSWWDRLHEDLEAPADSGLFAVARAHAALVALSGERDERNDLRFHRTVSEILGGGLFSDDQLRAALDLLDREFPAS
jgi:hypothetical protein